MPAARELYDRINSGRLVMISSTVSSLIVTTIMNVVSGEEKSTVEKTSLRKNVDDRIQK